MNTPPPQNPSEWLTKIKQLTIAKQAGEFLAYDNANTPIILAWEIIDQQSPRLNEKIKTLSEILIQTYTQQELLFAKQYPGSIANEYFLKSLLPLFQNSNANVQWPLVAQQLTEIFKKFFIETDFTKMSPTNDLHVFVVAKDKTTGSALGLIQFLITPEYSSGTVKAAFYGVLSTAHDRGLEKILMSSIFKLLPALQRIFLHTRSSNENTIKMYSAWGFTQFDNKTPNWPDFEYLTKNSTALQQISAKIDSI